jgi:hypothetical protein
MATTILSLDIDRPQGDRPRKILHAELRTRRTGPFALTSEYRLRCLKSDSSEPHGYRELHDLAVSAQLKLPGFALTYHPRFSHSLRPELTQHRLASNWTPLRQLALEASIDRARHSPMGKHGMAHEIEDIKTGCRMSPTSSVRLDFLYRRSERTSAFVRTSYLNQKWQAGFVTALGGRASLQVGLTDMLTAQNQEDARVGPFRDRTIDVRATRDLSSGLLAYVEVGITRRDASATGYSRSPGAGLRWNTGRGMTAEVSYRAVMWDGLPARDSENLGLQVNSAETWLSSNCRLEYVSRTRPISKLLRLSIEASLHF